jgi:hypothetical protein
MALKHTHPDNCPDRKAAAADRKQHEAARVERQSRQQALAHAEWFDWYAVTLPHERRLPRR